MANFSLEIAPYKSQGHSIFVITGFGNNADGYSHSRTYYTIESLMYELDAVAIYPKPESMEFLAFGRKVEVAADKHSLQLLGVWEPISIR